MSWLRVESQKMPSKLTALAEEQLFCFRQHYDLDMIAVQRTVYGGTNLVRNGRQ